MPLYVVQSPGRGNPMITRYADEEDFGEATAGREPSPGHGICIFEGADELWEFVKARDDLMLTLAAEGATATAW